MTSTTGSKPTIMVSGNSRLVPVYTKRIGFDPEGSVDKLVRKLLVQVNACFGHWAIILQMRQISKYMVTCMQSHNSCITIHQIPSRFSDIQLCVACFVVHVYVMSIHSHHIDVSNGVEQHTTHIARAISATCCCTAPRTALCVQHAH